MLGGWAESKSAGGGFTRDDYAGIIDISLTPTGQEKQWAVVVCQVDRESDGGRKALATRACRLCAGQDRPVSEGG